MNQPLRLGIAGLGTVGAGVVKIIQSKSELLRMRTGRDIEIVAVSARSAGKDRGVDLSIPSIKWFWSYLIVTKTSIYSWIDLTDSFNRKGDFSHKQNL